MLQQVCEHLHNYFISSVHPGTYEIADGVISPSLDLKEGQRFWITSSDLNDGIYTYHAAGIKNDDDTKAAVLQDEEFGGTICAMAVPVSVVALAKKIGDWLDKYADAVNSPYQSENMIGVYSYTKASGGGEGGSGSVTWESQFASELKRWRKVCV